MTKNIPLYEKWTTHKIYIFNEWTSYTEYFVDFSGILFDIKLTWKLSIYMYTVLAAPWFSHAGKFSCTDEFPSCGKET